VKDFTWWFKIFQCWGKKWPWHNRVADLAGYFATWQSTWFRLWR